MIMGSLMVLFMKDVYSVMVHEDVEGVWVGVRHMRAVGRNANS